MTKKTYCYFFLTIFATGCVSDKQSSDSIPFIDVRKNYPEKEIVLTDIADISYLHLSTKNEDYLYKGGIQDITENTILVFDWATNSVLFFSRDGNPRSRFNRLGQGPEEYTGLPFWDGMYDEASDEVYIPAAFGIGPSFIYVYSSAGEYRRKLNLPQGVSISGMVFFDDQSILLHDGFKPMNKTYRRIAGDHSAFSPQLNDSSFLLVSKIDGKVLEYVEVPSPTVDLAINANSSSVSYAGYQRIAKCADGFLLCNPENDTIYLYSKDKSLTPILRKIPLLSQSNIRVLGNCVDAGKYQFMKVSNRVTGPRQDLHEVYYMRDKETGEVFRQKFTLPDYKGKEFFIHASILWRYFENEYHFTLSLSELKQADKENRLSGALKELVATLNEMEDNDVYMFVKFK